MNKRVASLVLLASFGFTHSALAFCGFYVAKGDAKIFNKASQVALVRDGDRTVMTMANDFKGDPKEFAVVVPVPTVLKKGQIHIAEKALLDHLDAYSAPRLVEYFDENPCRVHEERMSMRDAAMTAQVSAPSAKMQANRGVTIEARYTVGEYDILILSAKESKGLETWLRENDYRIPAGASSVLESYIRQNMKFFVAKVNIKEQTKLGFNYLRPIQVAYESPKFMLPIRLGTVNASGPQDLLIYALTRNGRVETTNYRTVKLPSDVEIPVYVKDRFPSFYRDMFASQVRKEEMSAVFLEYAWDMGWCDPCAADPLSPKELRNLGVFWLEGGQDISSRGMMPQGTNVFITRLHVRYDRGHFPEDLVFQMTGDKENFQARYVLRHPYAGSIDCGMSDTYRESVRARREKEAKTLASLTGWSLVEIRKTARLGDPAVTPASQSQDKPWWEKIWQ